MSSDIKHTIGTVISGTSDSKTIAQALLLEVKRHDADFYLSLNETFNSIEDFESEEGQELLVELMESLDSYADAEYVFTSHPYEPLNYGFWSTTLLNN